MPQSLVKILVHILFSTKNRVDIITPDIETRLYGYIGGIIENNAAKMIVAGGMPDHGDLLVSMRQDDGRQVIAILLKEIKIRY